MSDTPSVPAAPALAVVATGSAAVPAPLAPLTPGYKTTEGWLSLLQFTLGGAAAAGFFGSGMLMQVAGLAASALAVAGHVWSRTTLKAGAQ